MSDELIVSIDKYLPLRDLVFNAIRDSILNGDLKPGERLMENQLSEKIGVSRTPVREALRKLELESFVEIVPRKGAIVKIITPQDVKNVLEIRGALESLAAKLACDKMTNSDIEKLKIIAKEFENSSSSIEKMAIKDHEFHSLIFESSQNIKLVTLINNLHEQIYRYRVAYLKDKDNIANIINEHNEIIEAITTRSLEGAEKVSLNHILNQEKAIIASIH